ncbi:1a, partial [Symbiodinium sp. CCMP2456]
MCGPEVPQDYQLTRDVEGRDLVLEVRKGLYHDLYPESQADLVIAMNAGMGVPQYAKMWGPTLNTLSQRRGGLLAVTSYSPGELVREEKLLRRLWPLRISPASPDLKEILLTMRAGQSHTLQRNAGATTLRGAEVSLKRGDVLEFVSGAAGLHVVCRETLLY